MTKEGLIAGFKKYDYDWISLGNDHCIKEYVKLTDRYVEDIITSLKDILDEIEETPDDSVLDVVYIKETIEDIIKQYE